MFLEIVTRTYRRPLMLLVNRDSIARFTSDDYLQVILPDDVGRGVGWANAQFADYAPNVTGDYVWILDDDDECIRETLVDELKAIAAEHDPDVIMLKMDHGEMGILPDRTWGKSPEFGDIGMSAFVVKREVWQRHAPEFARAKEGGDFDFIRSIFAARQYSIHWHNVVASRVQRISRGAPE